MEKTQFDRTEVAKLVGSRLLIGIPVLVLVLFLPAGTLAYWEAWLFLAVLLIPMSFVMIYFVKTAPEFLVRRMKYREKEGTQRRIISLALIPFLLQFILPGIDKRLGWSDIPVMVVILADVVVLTGYCFILWVFKENRFASRIVEVDERQKVIQTGPYRLVRHPMYLGTLIMYLASPIALGSYWAIIPALFIIPVLVARILNEEQVLERELEGYSAYQLNIKYRLIPGIW